MTSATGGQFRPLLSPIPTGPCELRHRGVDFSPLLVEVANGS